MYTSGFESLLSEQHYQLMCWGGHLSQRRQEARLILLYKIINGLAQVPFECVLFEVYKDTRRKHNLKFRQIGHTTSQYGQLFLS